MSKPELIAIKINHFAECVCGRQTVELRGKSMAAGNKG